MGLLKLISIYPYLNKRFMHAKERAQGIINRLHKREVMSILATSFNDYYK